MPIENSSRPTPFRIVAGVSAVSEHVAAERVDGGGLGLFDGDRPQPEHLAAVFGDVARREHPAHPGPHPVVDQDALVDGNPGVAGQVDVGADAGRRQEELARHVCGGP